MTTYTITLTGTFDAATEAEALLDFEEWVAQRGTVTNAVVTIEPDDGDDPYRPVFNNPQAVGDMIDDLAERAGLTEADLTRDEYDENLGWEHGR